MPSLGLPTGVLRGTLGSEEPGVLGIPGQRPCGMRTWLFQDPGTVPADPPASGGPAEKPFVSCRHLWLPDGLLLAEGSSATPLFPDQSKSMSCSLFTIFRYETK